MLVTPPACCRCSGGLDFQRMLAGDSGVAMQKTACLLEYFRWWMQPSPLDEERIVRFELITGGPVEEFEAKLAAASDSPVLPSGTAPLALHNGPMEEPEAHVFVNFANANFGYGRFIASCTQEEIMQMCVPEFNVGMLHVGKLAEHEVVVTYNCRRFSTYSGYQYSFMYTGACNPSLAASVQAVLTMDACYFDHFDRRQQLRDVQKAFLGFDAVRRSAHLLSPATVRPVISSGRWGCGIFGGSPAHKLLQQLVALRLAGGVEVRFSMFGTPDGCDTCLQALATSPKLTLQKLWTFLCDPATSDADIVPRLLAFLEQESASH